MESKLDLQCATWAWARPGDNSQPSVPLPRLSWTICLHSGHRSLFTIVVNRLKLKPRIKLSHQLFKCFSASHEVMIHCIYIYNISASSFQGFCIRFCIGKSIFILVYCYFGVNLLKRDFLSGCLFVCKNCSFVGFTVNKWQTTKRNIH